jgi:hypothetical protein
MECKALEELSPDDKNAIATDELSIRTGRLQFPGMGLPRMKLSSAAASVLATRSLYQACDPRVRRKRTEVSPAI